MTGYVVLVGNTVSVPTRFAAARSRRHSAAIRVSLPRQRQVPVGHEVEQDHGFGVLVTGCRALCFRAGPVE